MPEFSREMQGDLVSEIRKDANRILQETTGSWSGTTLETVLGYAQLEQLVYITEQIRLKLRLLGAPRIDR